MQSVTSAFSVFQRFLNCQTRPFCFIAQGLDVHLAIWSSRDWFLRLLSRCVHVFTPVWWHALIITLSTEAYTWHWLSIKLEISQVGRPNMVSKQNKWVSNMKAGHKSHNLVNVGGFFLQTGRLDPFLVVLRNFLKSAVRLWCVISAYAADFGTYYTVYARLTEALIYLKNSWVEFL